MWKTRLNNEYSWLDATNWDIYSKQENFNRATDRSSLSWGNTGEVLRGRRTGTRRVGIFDVVGVSAGFEWFSYRDRATTTWAENERKDLCSSCMHDGESWSLEFDLFINSTVDFSRGEKDKQGVIKEKQNVKWCDISLSKYWKRKYSAFCWMV